MINTNAEESLAQFSREVLLDDGLDVAASDAAEDAEHEAEVREAPGRQHGGEHRLLRRPLAGP